MFHNILQIYNNYNLCLKIIFSLLMFNNYKINKQIQIIQTHQHNIINNKHNKV